MGKRTNHSARSVITPDALLNIDEVGVPAVIAANQTLPDRVTTRNRKMLRDACIRGPGVLRGAQLIRYEDGRMVSLAMVKDRATVPLPIGAVVERHLRDGDVVVMNRQPSLHKESMMGHYARLNTHSKTLTLPVLDCTPYNADFDGDEMNLHTPQTERARAEAIELMGVAANILSPQANKPVIGAMQDVLLGGYLVTGRDVFFTKDVFFQIIMQSRYGTGRIPVPAILKPQPLWTGKQAMSYILQPRPIFIDAPCGGAADRNEALAADQWAVVRNGTLHAGQLVKTMLGTSQGGLTHMLCVDAGDQAAMEFLSDLSRVACQYLLYRGFSIGIGDCVSPPHVDDRVSDVVERAIHLMAHEAPKICDPHLREEAIGLVGRKVMEVGGKIVLGGMRRDNAFKTMVACGSKGSNINILQVAACIGQVTVSAQRISGESVLPSFAPGGGDPVSRGLCPNHFVGGITSEEFFLHAQGGREGLVDTAVKTAVTGYISRRLVKIMESLSIAHGGRVVSIQDGACVAQRYGGDGVDSRFVERVRLREIGMNDVEVDRYYGGRRDEVLRALDFRDRLRNIKCWTRAGSKADPTLMVPVHIPRILTRCRAARGAGAVTAAERDAAVEEIIHEATRALGGAEAAVHVHAVAHSALRLCELQRRGVGSDTLRACVAAVVDRLHRTQIDAASMVGAVAAHAIGEPCTQMTLKYVSVGCVAGRVSLFLSSSRPPLPDPASTVEFQFRKHLPYFRRKEQGQHYPRSGAVQGTHRLQSKSVDAHQLRLPRMALGPPAVRRRGRRGMHGARRPRGPRRKLRV